MRSKNMDQLRAMKEYLEEYAMEHDGYIPTMTEIAEAFRISRAGAFRYLKEMDERGMVIYRDGRIVTEKTRLIRNREGGLSEHYMEGISAGTPTDASGKVEEYYSMPPLFTDGRRGHFFTLTVNGDSMTDAGIESGDLVIWRETKEAETEQIVAAWIPGEGNTLKRLCRDDEGPFLWAENHQWPPARRMFGREFMIQGVAIKVLKDL